MNVLDLMDAALAAVTADPSRPATAVVHDTPALRLVVFRIEPGQEVAAHTNDGTVLLTVLSGRGTISGADGSRDVGPGTVVTYDPREPHGMRAGTERFCLVATIIRPR
ncbi:MAG: cupin domain-containing protein [Gemmatimonadota bacterium]